MSPRVARRTYRHGDLAHALVAAGVDLARGGGPEAVVLREATRRAGVAPNAAYRHFADRADLLRAVGDEAMSLLAGAMEDEQARIPEELPGRERAAARLRATGLGYLRFAAAEPGLFRTAFAVAGSPDQGKGPDAAGPGGLPPFELLSEALDGLVEAGVLPPDRRLDAEYVAWSAVHGLSALRGDGPLRYLEEGHAERVSDRLLETVLSGLMSPPQLS